MKDKHIIEVLDNASITSLSETEVTEREPCHVIDLRSSRHVCAL
jgi:hypothetical protein